MSALTLDEIDEGTLTFDLSDYRDKTGLIIEDFQKMQSNVRKNKTTSKYVSIAEEKFRPFYIKG